MLPYFLRSFFFVLTQIYVGDNLVSSVFVEAMHTSFSACVLVFTMLGIGFLSLSLAL